MSGLPCWQRTQLSSESSGRQKKGRSCGISKSWVPQTQNYTSQVPHLLPTHVGPPTWHASPSQATRGHHIIPDDLCLGSHIPTSQVASCHLEQRETLRLLVSSTSIPWVGSSATDGFCVITVHLDSVLPIICSKLLTSHAKSLR